MNQQNNNRPGGVTLGGAKKKRDNIYCGIAEKAPEGKVLGTAKQCALRNQVRRFGLKQIDRQLLNKTLKFRKLEQDEAKAAGKIAQIRLMIADLRSNLRTETDAKVIKKLKARIKEKMILLESFKELYHKFKKKREKDN